MSSHDHQCQQQQQQNEHDGCDSHGLPPVRIVGSSIPEMIPGRRNAIRGKELAKMFGHGEDRHIRVMIDELRTLLAICLGSKTKTKKS